jgi:EpsI family protein
MNNPMATLTFSKLPIASGILLSICGLLFWGLFRSSLGLLFSTWGDGDYSYAWLIPFVILYLVWEKRDRLSAEPVVGAWWGIAPLIFGIGLFWLGELGGEYYTLYVSAWLILVGILWLHLGRRKMKVLLFPVFLIPTTFPFPAFVYYKTSFQLQLISSKIGATLLQIVGVVVHREGNVIDIGVTQLQVVQACSGLRYVLPLLILGLVVAYFYRASFWKRAFLVLSTIPLTIFWNSTRIALTGILWIKWGPGIAEGFLHDFSGFVIFLVSLAVLLGEMWVLSRIGRPAYRPGGSGKGAEVSGMQKGADGPPLSKGEGRDNRFIPLTGFSWKEGELRATSRHEHLPRTLTALVLLGATVICFSSIDFRPRIPIREPLSKFPLSIAEWRGTRGQIDPEELRWLSLSDYTLIDYRNKTGQDVNFYVAYFETQIKGGSLHSPETCLPGSGWVFKESGSLTIPVQFGEGYLKVNRVLMEQLGRKMLGYFWFEQRGRDLTTIYQLKLYNFWDALTQRRTDGALVRVLTPMAGIESVDEAGARLNEFLDKVVPALAPFIPGRELHVKSTEN